MGITSPGGAGGGGNGGAGGAGGGKGGALASVSATETGVVIDALAGAALAGAALTGDTLGAEPVFGAGVPLLFWFPTAAALDTLKPGGGWSGGFGPETSAARELFANSCFSSGSHLCPLSLLLWLFKASAVSPTDDTLSSGLIALAMLPSSSTSMAASPRGVSTIALFERLTLLSISGH